MVNPHSMAGAAGSRPPLRAVLPLVWELVRPRRGLLAAGFVLMAINRVASLVLPYSTRYLIDSVVIKRNVHLLKPLVLGVLLATVVQGITSFALTQLLSKAAQRLIAELRQKVQAHIGRLSISFHDSTKSGVLVSRIMTDVEGVRNLIGTGSVDLGGRTAHGGDRVGGSVPNQHPDDGTRIRFPAVFRTRFEESISDDPANLSRARQNQRRSYWALDGISWRRAGRKGLPRRGAGGKGFFARARCDYSITSCAR
jgi:ABC-type multidrug transport system fused ATPase/permease subunit